MSVVVRERGVWVPVGSVGDGGGLSVGRGLGESSSERDGRGGDERGSVRVRLRLLVRVEGGREGTSGVRRGGGGSRRRSGGESSVGGRERRGEVGSSSAVDGERRSSCVVVGRLLLHLIEGSGEGVVSVGERRS